MGQPLLQRQALLVKVLAPPPEVERDSPAGLLFLAQDLDDLLQPTLVMRGQRVDAARDVGEWPPVRREHLPGFEGCHAAQAGEVVVERVGRALGMKADIRRKLGQDVVAGEQHAAGGFEEADMSGRVARRPLHAQPVATHHDELRPIELDRRVSGFDDLAQRAL